MSVEDAAKFPSEALKNCVGAFSMGDSNVQKATTVLIERFHSHMAISSEAMKEILVNRKGSGLDLTSCIDQLSVLYKSIKERYFDKTNPSGLISLDSYHDSLRRAAPEHAQGSVAVAAGGGGGAGVGAVAVGVGPFWRWCRGDWCWHR